MLIDSHCHLDFSDFAADMAGVVGRAQAAGVEVMVDIATSTRDMGAVIATAEAFPAVWCSVGIHPEHVGDTGQDISTEELIKLAAHPRVVGIGETGLDYHYEGAPHGVQQQAFRRHLHAAVACDLPVIIHSREAEDDTIQILREEIALVGVGKLRGVLHCFSSERRLAEAAVEMGLYVSFSGILTFKKSVALRDVARDLPLDRLLVETDAPFLAPEPHRGKVCEPAHVVHTARALAEVRQTTFDDIAATTTANFFRLFTRVHL